MKVSDVDSTYLANYLRIDYPNEADLTELTNIISNVIDYITNYTGLTTEEIDSHEDITDAMLILCADRYDNRNLYIDSKINNINKSVNCILGMHSVNLL